MAEKPKVLYVDDELDNLIVFKSAFRREYDVITAQSAPDALQILKEAQVELVITDQRMPGMTGIDLLKSLPDEPEVMRIILTGFSDIQAVIEAINSGKVYQYITKPWDRDKLKLTIDKALETLGLRTYNKELVEQLREANSNLERKVEMRTREIEEQKKLLENEKAKVDRLLLNILPEEVADELKQTGVSTAKRYEEVTVLFADFVDFTAMSDKHEPEEVVSQLDRFFVEFDHIIDQLGLEKIKTIGDAYMCAAGVPVPREDGAIKMIEAAIAMQAFVGKMAKDKHIWLNQLRIGIHTGPVVAGVVGKSKFAYDIWGDTVNKASRLERSSEPGMINVSEETMQHCKNHFKMEFRGEIHVKGKGHMRMYYVM